LVTPLEESYIRTGVFKMAFKCIPWIVALMVLAVFSSMILSSFQGQLASLAILSVFIPVLMDTGGNAGGQTTTLMIRGLALKEFTPKDFLTVIWKEFRVALVVSAAVSMFAFIWIMTEMYTNIVVYPTQIDGIPTVNGVVVNGWSLFVTRSSIAGLVAITLLFTIVISKIVGALLPLIFQSLKKDPALMSGPLITTVVDVCSLIIYFFICTQIFHLV
jgi:magnesium transporter